SASGGGVLYAANALDGTVSRIDAGTGHTAGPPLPAGAAPRDIVVGAAGRLLVVAASSVSGGALTLVTHRGGELSAQTVVLEAGAWDVTAAGDGGSYAAVV